MDLTGASGLAGGGEERKQAEGSRWRGSTGEERCWASAFPALSLRCTRGHPVHSCPPPAWLASLPVGLCSPASPGAQCPLLPVLIACVGQSFRTLPRTSPEGTPHPPGLETAPQLPRWQNRISLRVQVPKLQSCRGWRNRDAVRGNYLLQMSSSLSKAQVKG